MEEPATQAGKAVISLHWLSVFALLYLALPCMLFFSSWFTPWIAWPLNLGILWAIYSYAKNRKNTVPWRPRMHDWCLILLSAIMSIALFFITGIAGYVPSATDVLIFREALYNNLIHESWPVVLPNGKEMSYYLAGMLPPALVARFTEDYTLQRFIAVLWYALGFWLAMMLFFCRHGKCSLLFLLFMLAFKDPAYLFINIFAGNGEVWGLITRILGVDWENSYIGAAHPIKMMTINAQGCNFQSFSLLCAALILTNTRQQEKLIPLSIALILPSSPLGAIGCMPFALYAWVRHSKATLLSRARHLIVPVLIALSCAVYYLRADSATTCGFYGHYLQNWSYFLFNYYSAILLSALLLCWVLFPVLKRDILLRISLGCVFIVPWLFYGSSPESGMFGQNELWLKASIIYHMHLIAALCFNWSELPVIKYLYILSFAMLVLRDERLNELHFTGSPCVRDVWGGHLNHCHPSIYQKIPNCRKAFIPGSLLNKGEAEQVWPGLILPKAPGCDYSRPAMPDGRYVLPI